MEHVQLAVSTQNANDPKAQFAPQVRILISILNQAIDDAISGNITDGARVPPTKYEATEWLCDEDNEILQLCLLLANMDHDRILRKVAKEGWNLDL